jgi:uncharacterized protein
LSIPNIKNGLPKPVAKIAAMDSQLLDKLGQLQNLLQTSEKALIAYSGGVDSTLVAKVAYDLLGSQALAITAVSPSLLPEELEEAIAQADYIGIRHELVETEEMNNPNYTSNPVNRCYFCKSELHDTLKPLALARGYAYVIDGVNADDLRDYRPGIQAARERGARSPLAEIAITKSEVRQLSRYLNLPWWDKPAQPCLSSRFPYGEEISLEKLQRVGRAEIYLRKLGYRQLRVRSSGDTARIELPAAEIPDFINRTNLSELVADLQKLGFIYVSLDLEGYQSGKLNRVL